jgi:hypothetical protein
MVRTDQSSRRAKGGGEEIPIPRYQILHLIQTALVFVQIFSLYN